MIRTLVPEWNYGNDHKLPDGWFVWYCTECLMSVAFDREVFNELAETGEFSRSDDWPTRHSHEIVQCEDNLQLAVHYNNNSIIEIFCNTCGWREDLEGVVTVLDIEQAKKRHEKYGVS